jgi:glycine/D-amino acid oxidase-like deaminating enzyme
MRSEVIIIGAGIVGCAAAYYLACEGARVTIVERDSVGSHASGYALGGLNPLSGIGIPEPLGTLGLEGFRLALSLAPQLKEETGIDSGLQPVTAIALAFTEAEADLLRQRLPWQQAQRELQSEWQNTGELLAMEPRLSPQVVGGVVTQGVGLLDPYKLCLALLEAAIRRGATLRHGTVRDLKFRGDRIDTVRVGREEVPCGAVVMAMGPWAAEAAPWTGVEVPVRPLKGQILRLRMPGPPFSYISSPDSYVATKPDGLVWAGTTEEEVGFDEAPSREARQEIIGNVVRTFPSLKEAEVVLQTACLRPVAVDGLPILGSVPGKKGAVVATGAGRKGILLGPIMGRIAADLAITGGTKHDIAALRPGRPISDAQAATSRSEPLRF